MEACVDQYGQRAEAEDAGQHRALPTLEATGLDALRLQPCSKCEEAESQRPADVEDRPLDVGVGCGLVAVDRVGDGEDREPQGRDDPRASLANSCQGEHA